MLKISLVVLLLPVLLGTVIARCPPETVTRPCTCSQVNGGNVLRCVNITEKIILNGIFRRTNGTYFDQLQLVNTNIEEIPSRRLHTSHVKSLWIIDSVLKLPFDRESPPLTNLKSIHLQNVTFQEGLSWKNFKNMDNLTAFSANGTKIPHLDRTFKNSVSKRLTLFALINTSTLLAEDGAVSEHKNIQYFRLANNHVREFKRNDFPRPWNVTDLYLDGNALEKMPDNAFSEMPKLQTLDLSGNKITKVPDAMFSNINHQLSNLNLKDNLINCDCAFKWLLSHKPKSECKGKCESPEKLKGKLIKDLKIKDLPSCR